MLKEPDQGTSTGASGQVLSVRLSPERIAAALGLVALLFTVVSLIGSLLRPMLGEFVELFGLGNDSSVPSWYSAILFLFASGLLSAITCIKRLTGDGRHVRQWAVLSLIFLYLSTDEMLRLHERMSSTLLQPALDSLGFEPTGVLSYPWVIVYAPLVLVFALAYLRFWLSLPARIRALFFAAGALLVGGAVGAEMFNAWYDYVFGAGVTAGLMTHLEETLEALGVVVFVYALMSYISSYSNLEEVRIRLRPQSLNDQARRSISKPVSGGGKAGRRPPK